MFAVLTILIFPFFHFFSFIPGILFLFSLYFFRNPKRNIPESDELVLSPADGKVLSVDTQYEEPLMGGQCIKVSIFLSLLNVHLNRSPVKGKISYRQYRPGKYLPAFKSHASEINEKNTIGIETDRGMFMVSQITGFIARRIKCYVNPGEMLKQGQHFGIIVFGSCTEILLPDVYKRQIYIYVELFGNVPK